MALRESPPRSKKLAVTLTRFWFRTFFQMVAIFFSRSLAGGSWVWVGGASNEWTGGRAARSILPLGVRGKVVCRTK